MKKQPDEDAAWWTEFVRPVLGVFALFGGAVALGLFIGTVLR